MRDQMGDEMGDEMGDGRQEIGYGTRDCGRKDFSFKKYVFCNFLIISGEIEKQEKERITEQRRS